MSKWQRLLSFVLCLLLIFSSVVVKPLQANATAGTLILGTAAGITAPVSIPAVLTAITVLLAAGVVIPNLDGIIDSAEALIQQLSPETVAEFDSIAQSGEASFTLSDTAVAEINTFFIDLNLTEEQIKSLPFDGSGMLSYDPGVLGIGSQLSTTVPFGTLLTASGTDYELTPASVSENITFSFGWSNVSSSSIAVDKILLANSNTGVNGKFNLLSPSFLNSATGSHSVCVSSPVVQSYTENGSTFYNLGFYLLGSCLSDCHTSNKYKIIHVNNSPSDNLRSGFGFILNGTGNTAIDGYDFASWSFRSETGNYEYVYRNPVGGVSSIYADCTPMEMVFRDTYVITVPHGLTIPDTDDKLYFPTADAFSKVDTITQSQVTTEGFGSADVTTPLPPDLLSFIAEGVVNALKFCFVPGEGFFQNFFSDLQATFSDRMGLLTYPISILTDFLGSIASLGDAEPVLSWNAWSYQGHEVIPAGSYSMNDIIEENETFQSIYDIYLIVIDAVLIFAFLRFLDKKYHSIISS